MYNDDGLVEFDENKDIHQIDGSEADQKEAEINITQLTDGYDVHEGIIGESGQEGTMSERSSNNGEYEVNVYQRNSPHEFMCESSGKIRFLTRVWQSEKYVHATGQL